MIKFLRYMLRPNYNWHPWFAWYLVTIDDRQVWGKWIDRRAGYYRSIDSLRIRAVPMAKMHD